MPKTVNYTANDVKVLGEVEHIRLNPGMYIGSTDTPTHLLEEVLDNSLDEALTGYAKIIAVVIDTKENKFSVLDSGRGIPIDDNTPITISTKLFSGAKFHDRKTAYEIVCGAHGIGLIAVNALSTEYTVEVYRDNKHAIYEFVNTKLKRKQINPYKSEIPFSTKIEFIPDPAIFETLKPDLDRIRKRLMLASAEMPNDISFVLIVDGQKEIFQLDVSTYFNSMCSTSKSIDTSIYLQSEQKPEQFRALFTYNQQGIITPKIISSINLLPVDSGGTHVSLFYELLKEFFMAKGKKYGYSFQANDCLCGLRAYLMLSLVKPKFSGQTKDKLTNRKTDFTKFIKDFKTQLERFAKDQEPILIEYLERFSDYRKRVDAKRLNVKKTNRRRASTQFTKLRDCTSRKGELYLVEGESAAGGIITSRNPNIHAILPLKGKAIPNVTTKKNILDNKEVGELIKALGTGVEPEFDMTMLRYDKIVCATDADFDGNHIACLVTMVMGILVPNIVKAGRFFVAQTPLFAINEGKVFIPLWNDKEVENARAEGRKIQRYKGLGEMNPAQLKICLLDKKTRHLIPIQYSENINELVKLFSSSEEKRKLVTT